MNNYAASLGLRNTKFEDTSGLSSGNVSSAYDLFVLSRALYKKDPHIFDITKLKQFIGVHTGWMNNNPLVQMEGYEGGKHGFTYEANRTDVAFFKEKLASGNERIIGYVLLGSDNVPTDIEALRAEVKEKVRVE
jgi:D-alanyl-D-alanine carboxypeptidase